MNLSIVLSPGLSNLPKEMKKEVFTPPFLINFNIF